MLASAVLLFTGEPTPFGNVLNQGKSNGSTFRFYPSSAVKAGWRAWLAAR
jgi:hypothetical protein